ncbi:HAD-IC family P-type ATPase [Bulleidia sp. zg-1006]|uniref:HAD-IC family P-type ATPase n=2 Tax=Bulleidia sp. zg-1006 TaxID=2806552 RepID=UPI00193A2593|nr:HAD-IC family P-type ATPase [Bulleidia sp. zg-1006]QRG86183.1 HAD-IC family P-type ATPase [Bulleidia sp. zg-1006]
MHHKTKDTFWKDLFLEHIFTYFNFLNVLLFVWVASIGRIENGLFMGACLFAVVTSVYHSVKARHQLKKMELFVQEKYHVYKQDKLLLRDEIEVGDQIEISVGQQIPVDAILLEGNLEVNEALLTGEEQEVIKNPGSALIGGSYVLSGQAILKASTIAQESKAEQMIQEARKVKKGKMGLVKELDQFLWLISILLAPLGIALYLVQISKIGYEATVLATVAALIGMIPEGLLVLTSMSTMIGALRLSKRYVLTQNLNALENLARVDTICLDKTGTLTTGQLKVKEVTWLETSYERQLKLHISQETTNNPTQLALQKYFGKQEERLEEYLSFSSKRKYSASKMKDGSIFLVGSMESFGGELPEKLIWEQEAGNRVITLAQGKGKLDQIEGVKAIGYVVLEDELKNHIQETLAYLQNEHVNLRIISGDHERTVASIARKAGYQNLTRSANVNEKLDYSLQVFGRTLPEQKKDIIKHLQQEGHIVAMVGDGVNDVSALKQADVSISFERAHAAAKNVSDIVLVHNDFAQVPKAIEEGRRIIFNISNSASLYFMKTIYSFVLTILLLVLKYSYPFLPIHLTVLSAFGVGIPTFLLQWESHPDPIQKDYLKRAILKAVPCAFQLLLGIIVLRYLQLSRWILLWSAMSYIVALLVIYPPITKMRKIVIISMALAYSLIFLWLMLHQSMDVSSLQSLQDIGILLALIFAQSFFYFVLIGLKRKN